MKCATRQDVVYIARCLLEVRMRFSKLPIRIRLRWSSAGRALVERWSSKDRVLTWNFCLKNDNHGRYFTRVCNFFSFTLGFYTIKLAKVC